MQPDIDSSLLAPEHAFVIQFHANTDVDRGCMTGRVEHVGSGQATHFESLEALLALISRVHMEVRRTTPGPGV